MGNACTCPANADSVPETLDTEESFAASEIPDTGNMGGESVNFTSEANSVSSMSMVVGNGVSPDRNMPGQSGLVCGKTCGSGHILQFWQIPEGCGNVCNVCFKSADKTDLGCFWSCRECNFDICKRCSAAPNPESWCKSSSYPFWRRRNFQGDVSSESLKRLSEWRAQVEATTECAGNATMQFYSVINDLGIYYYDIINSSGGDCPFMSAEEVFEFYNLAMNIIVRWPRSRFLFEQVGLSSQTNTLVEIFEYGADEKEIPIRQCDIQNEKGLPLVACVQQMRQYFFPCWLAGRMFAGTANGKDALCTADGWGLGKTEAYQTALAQLLESSEGKMKCVYTEGMYCLVTNVKRDGKTIKIEFDQTGNKPDNGGLNDHNPKESVIMYVKDGQEYEIKPDTVKISKDSSEKTVGKMEFKNVLVDTAIGLSFRYSSPGCYSVITLNFDHPDAKLLPNYWDKSLLRCCLVQMNQGLSLKQCDNVLLSRMGAEHRAEGLRNMEEGDIYGHNLFGTCDLSEVALERFQQLFDISLKKKFTRDRKDGEGVPDRLRVTRGHRVQNVFNWTEYSARRWKIKEAMGSAKKKLQRSIDNLKTSGAFPNEECCYLDSDANEAFLFHGTNDFAAGKITRGDFLVNLAGSNAGTLYGKGVYLAESVSKSDEYTQENANGERCILVCRATLGFVNYNDEVAPDVDKLVKSCTNGPYHCVLGDREKCRGTFREIIVYDDDQVYPEYVIWYKREYE